MKYFTFAELLKMAGCTALAVVAAMRALELRGRMRQGARVWNETEAYMHGVENRAIAEHAAEMKAYEAWHAERVRQRFIQWPWAWADAVLAAADTNKEPKA